MSTKNGKATVPTTKPMNKVMIFSRESALAPGFLARHAPPAVTRLECVHFRIYISQIYCKGGFFSESAIRFSNLKISKTKNIPKNYPELEI